VMRLVYDPVVNGLKPCAALRRSGDTLQIADLFGHLWQLTGSSCKPFGRGSDSSCPDEGFVRKGGTAGSRNPLECMPEYRSAIPGDLELKDTALRLVLLDG